MEGKCGNERGDGWKKKEMEENWKKNNSLVIKSWVSPFTRVFKFLKNKATIVAISSK